MARSVWKLNFFSKNCLKLNFQKKSHSASKKIIIFNKSNIVLNSYANDFVYIHKGLFFKKLFVSSKLIGKKFSSFVFTKKPFNYPVQVKAVANSERR